ncbi:hypothetical protein G7046_g9352 [Stylonectria norvegica]|nr:hypothetical protein G7046_g9352 [Stylonectria norvegica]
MDLSAVCKVLASNWLWYSLVELDRDEVEIGRDGRFSGLLQVRAGGAGDGGAFGVNLTSVSCSPSQGAAHWLGDARRALRRCSPPVKAQKALLERFREYMEAHQLKVQTPLEAAHLRLLGGSRPLQSRAGRRGANPGPAFSNQCTKAGGATPRWPLCGRGMLTASPMIGPRRP